jgi:hypothetical protein
MRLQTVSDDPQLLANCCLQRLGELDDLRCADEDRAKIRSEPPRCPRQDGSQAPPKKRNVEIPVSIS